MAGTDGDEHLIGSHSIAPGGFKVCNGPAQGKGALVGCIVGLACGQSRYGGGLDGLGGIKIRFSDGQHGAVGDFPGHVGVDPDGAALETVEVLVQRDHTNCSARASKKSAPFNRIDSSKSKVSAWRAGVSPSPRKKNMPGRYR